MAIVKKCKITSPRGDRSGILEQKFSPLTGKSLNSRAQAILTIILSDRYINSYAMTPCWNDVKPLRNESTGLYWRCCLLLVYGPMMLYFTFYETETSWDISNDSESYTCDQSTQAQYSNSLIEQVVQSHSDETHHLICFV